MNGPSSVLIDASDPVLRKAVENDDFLAANNGVEINISDLIQTNPEAFLGKGYSQRYPDANSSLAFLFKVLSVN